jgi:hypothetical protein
LQADGDARSIHHPEHLRHALVQLALPAHRHADTVAVLAEVEHASGRSVDAHLALDGAHRHVVASQRIAVLIDAPPGDDEQGEALGPGRRSADARQHQMNDVLRQVVVAGGDEDPSPVPKASINSAAL